MMGVCSIGRHARSEPNNKPFCYLWNQIASQNAIHSNHIAGNPVMKGLGAKLFNDSVKFEQDGRRFYQLFRNYLLGAALSEKWGTKFSLLTIVNSLNRNLEGRSH